MQNKKLAHEDPNDKAQTVVVEKEHVNPNGSIGTTVKAGDSTGSADAAASVSLPDAKNGVSVVDTISYKGLVAGETYTVTGTLNRVENGEVKEEIATVTETKVADAAEGTWTIDFGTQVLEAGQTYVVYEKAISSSNQVDTDNDNKPDVPQSVVHEDPNDKAQTVVVDKEHQNPEGSMKTTVKAGDSTGSADKAATVTTSTDKTKVNVVDTITYEGLVAGEKYEVTGTLYLVENGEAKEAIATVTETKTADAANGTWTIDFGSVEVQAGKSYVVFEKGVSVNALVDTDNDNKPDSKQEVSHEDPKDKSQTVTVVKGKTPGKNVFTGLNTNTNAYILIALVSLGAILWIVKRRKA